MNARRPPWTATLRLDVRAEEPARWIEQALAPEAAREVPRARTSVHRSGTTVELRMEATDAGAMRAALNTYLGWIALSLATLRAADGASPGDASAPRGEAVISRSR